MHGLIRNYTSLVNAQSNFSLKFCSVSHKSYYMVLEGLKDSVMHCIGHFQVYDVVCPLQCNFVKSFKHLCVSLKKESHKGLRVSK